MKRSLNTYVWVPGWQKARATDPQEVGAYLETFGSSVTVDAILYAATRRNSPLHNLFTWSDEKAAMIQRRSEARMILNHLRIERSGALHHAFLSIKEGKKRKYVHFTQLPEYAIVDKAEGELKQWVKRYRDVRKLTSLVGAVSALVFKPVARRKYA